MWQEGTFKKYLRSKRNGYGGNPSKNSTNYIPEWVTNKPVVSYTKDIATATITHNNNKYRGCIYFNNGNVAWGFHHRDGHEEWKNKQVNKIMFDFPIRLPMQ